LARRVRRARLVGVPSQGLPVSCDVVLGLSVEPAEGGVRVRGDLMESSRVFAGADVSYDGRVLVTIRSRLVDDRPGNTEFDVVVPVDLPSGPHGVTCVGSDGERYIGHVEV
jgi:hypothetical protein